MADSIGTAAGIVWQYLNKKGESSVTKITKETKLDAKTTQRAIGWLSAEGKLAIDTQGRTEVISLK
ncbi:MAG: winged helix-turn-helix domain-containing protein [Methylophagaceae bacterium]